MNTKIALRITGMALMATALSVACAGSPLPARHASASEEFITTPSLNDTKWNEFVTRYVTPLQKSFPSYGIFPMEYRSERQKRVLPGYRVFVAKNAPTTEAGPYMMTPDGSIHHVRWEFSFRKHDKYLINESLTKFVKERRLGRITTLNEAVDFARLLDSLSSVAGRPMEPLQEIPNAWKFEATRTGNWWIVERVDNPDYKGPPFSSTAYYPWHIETDDSGFVVDVKKSASLQL